MFCKHCGNPNVKVGKYCSRCGKHIEAPLVESFTNESNSTYKTKKYKSRQIEPNQDPEESKRLLNGLFITGVILLNILKVLGMIAFVVIYIMLGVIFGLASGKKSRKMPNLNWARTHHYGYRYGRWYYGDGHRYGCQNGNGHDGCFRE